MQKFGTFSGAGFFLWFSSAVWGQVACDLNRDGLVNSVDVQLASRMASGSMPCSAAVAGIGVCNATVVNRVALAASGAACLVADANTVPLSWEPGSGPDFVGYNLHRSPNSWGPLTRLNTNTLLAPVFTDEGAPSGQRVYYTVATVESI